MKAGLVSGDPLLVLANAMRHGRQATAFDLWRLADQKAAANTSGDRVKIRLLLFRHAAIHAGLVRTRRGTAYRRCAMCREKLL